MKRPEIVLLSLLLISIAAYKLWNHRRVPVDTPPTVRSVDLNGLNFNTAYHCKEIWVISADTFDINLENDKLIKVHLRVSSPKKAEKEVIELLNRADTGEQPEVVLIKKTDEYWIADISIKINGEKVDLAKWLEDKGLVYH